MLGASARLVQGINSNSLVIYIIIRYISHMNITIYKNSYVYMV